MPLLQSTETLPPASDSPYRGAVYYVSIRAHSVGGDTRAADREGTAMAGLTRRSLINRSIAFAAAGTIARPYIANAQAKTAVLWWAQGFVQEEDISIKKIVADYQKASGNTIDMSIMPFAPMRQKIVSA